MLTVTRWKPGDEVYGEADGTFAELVCVDESLVATKPATLTFAEAAAVPLAGVTALMGVRDLGQVGPGERLLVNGASGGVGSFAVQIAKAAGAEVTRSAAPATSSWSGRWAPTTSSTTRARTSPARPGGTT